MTTHPTDPVDPTPSYELLGDLLRTEAAATADCPSMFYRVAAGVKRRRRRRRLIATVVPAVVLGTAVAVPAISTFGGGAGGSTITADSASVGDPCTSLDYAPDNAYMRSAYTRDCVEVASTGPDGTVSYRWYTRRLDQFQP